MVKNRYKVHRLEVKSEDIYTSLEKFINDLKGEVISVFPNIKKGSLPQIYGVTARVDFIIIVEGL